MGYSGGNTRAPTYAQVCSGATGHTEVVQVTYDPAKISYEKLLDLFWKSHDPCGSSGCQYKSVIFYHTPEQQKAATAAINKLNVKLEKSGATVSTDILPAKTFYRAEEYHQHYYEKQGICKNPPSRKERESDMKNKPDEYWRKTLTPEQYNVLRLKATERPFMGKLLYNKEKGTYTCAACGNELFASDSKFDSGCGWPAFDKPFSDKSVEYREDTSHGMVRTEVLCKKCGGHLGHVFDDGPRDTTGMRFCINSVSLEFKKHGSK